MTQSVQRPFHLRIDLPSDRRWRHAVARADEQVIAEPITQARKRMAGRRLRLPKPLGSSGDRAGLINRLKDREQVQVDVMKLRRRGHADGSHPYSLRGDMVSPSP